MRAFYRQLDGKSLVIGILISTVVLFVLDGVKGRAQVRSTQTITRYELAVGEDGPYVLDTTTGSVTRPAVLGPVLTARPSTKYQIIAGDGGVYILDEKTGIVGYRSNKACSEYNGCAPPR